jgi:hypothetical protein
VALGGIREAADGGVRFIKLLSYTLPARIEVNGELIEPVGPRAYRYMAERFNRMMVSVRRRWSFVYFRVVEEQRRGAPHYHLLVATRSYMPVQELRALAVRAGLGSNVDILAVRSHKAAARYVTKYVTKDAGGFVPARFRFYTRSRAFGVEARGDAMADKAARCSGWSYAYVREGDAVRVLPELAAVGYAVELASADNPEEG